MNDDFYKEQHEHVRKQLPNIPNDELAERLERCRYQIQQCVCWVQIWTARDQLEAIRNGHQMPGHGQSTLDNHMERIEALGETAVMFAGELERRRSRVTA
ncbi:MAG: hypothetical protein ACOC93_02180 [Planctomycetota bacterium]